MSPGLVETSLRWIDDSIVMIHVRGEITSMTEEKILQTYLQATQSPLSVIVWDFSELEYINSSGIGLLLTLLVRARRQGVHTCAFGLHEHYQHIFKLSRLDEVIALFENETVALRELAFVHA